MQDLILLVYIHVLIPVDHYSRHRATDEKIPRSSPITVGSLTFDLMLNCSDVQYTEINVSFSE